MIDQTSQKLAELAALIEEIPAKIELRKSGIDRRNGSTLTSEHYSAYRPQELAISYLTQKFLIHPDFSKVQALIKKYYKTIQKLAEKKKLNEVDDIQTNTTNLYKDILDILDPNSEIKVFYTNSTETEYATQLVQSEKTTLVYGYTDKTSCFRNIPIGVWEDKVLDSDLKAKSHIAQALAEVDGSAKKFKDQAGFEPKKYVGILTSTESWMLILRSFKDGAVLYLVTDMFSVKSNQIDEITCMVMEHFSAMFLLKSSIIRLQMDVIRDGDSSTDDRNGDTFDDDDGNNDGSGNFGDGGDSKGSKLNSSSFPAEKSSSTTQQKTKRSSSYEKKKKKVATNNNFAVLTRDNLQNIHRHTPYQERLSFLARQFQLF